MTQPADTPEPTTAEEEEPARGVRISSIVSVPEAEGGGGWSFGADQTSFGVRVQAEGSGLLELSLRLVSEPDGRTLFEREERFEIAGRRDAVVESIPLPDRGAYRLSLEVSAPGIRQSSEIRVTRG